MTLSPVQIGDVLAAKRALVTQQCESDPAATDGRWAQCMICGLGLRRSPGADSRRAIVCAGCQERLELESRLGLVKACRECGRHPELCRLVPCGRFDDSVASQPAGYAEGARSASLSSRVVRIALDEIRETPEDCSVRDGCQDASISELAASVKQHGLLHPLGVRSTDSGYVLVYGLRRLRAARLAGLSAAPCTICEADEQRGFLLSVVENLQRRQLSGRERMRAIDRLAGTHLGIRELSRQTGFDPSTISRWLKMDRRPALRQALESDCLDIGKATILVDAPEQSLPILLAEAPGLTQSELRRKVRELKMLRKPTRVVSADTRRLQEVLRLLRSVGGAGVGDQEVLAQIGVELKRLHVARALAEGPRQSGSCNS